MLTNNPINNSYIIPSSNCKNCDSMGVVKQDRLVLRTPEREICTVCGTTVEPYIAFSGEPVDVLPIPSVVSKILERLLHTKLFQLGWRSTPEIQPSTPFPNDEQLRTLAHRTGAVAQISLIGPGNCEARLRWSYSDASLFRQSAELPELSSVNVPIPPRISRAARQLSSSLDFQGLHRSSQSPNERKLRFQKPFALDKQPIPTASLLLVVSAELAWLQVGTSFPREDGLRQYTSTTRGRLLTFEEALDRELIRCVEELRSTPGMPRFSSGTPVIPDLAWQVAEMLRVPAGNERVHLINAHASGRYYGPVVSAEAALACGHAVLLPFDSCFYVNFDLTDPHLCSFKATLDGKEILSDELESMPGSARRAIGKKHRSIALLLKTKPGRLAIKLTYGTPQGSAQLREEELSFQIVPQKEYEKEWDRFAEAKLEELKRQMIRSHYARDLGKLSKGDPVAVRIEGWVEAAWHTDNPDGLEKPPFRAHCVTVQTPAGAQVWVVEDIMRLDDALAAGLDVKPSVDPFVGVGAHARLLR